MGCLRLKLLRHKITLVTFNYLSVGVGEGDAQVGHRPENGHQRLDGVTVDYRTILFEIFGRETALVDNSEKN